MFYGIWQFNKAYEYHPGDQTKMTVLSRWPFYRGSFIHEILLWDLEIVANDCSIQVATIACFNVMAFISGWLLYTGSHYDMFYCTWYVWFFCVMLFCVVFVLSKCNDLDSCVHVARLCRIWGYLGICYYISRRCCYLPRCK